MNFSQIGTVGAGQTTYAATSLTPARVILSGSAPITGMTRRIPVAPPQPPRPSFPSPPMASARYPISSTQINLLSWNSEANETQGFAVERSTDGVNYTQVTTLASYLRTYQVTGLTARDDLYLPDRAYNIAGNSLVTETTTATTTAAIPADPSGLTATAVGNRDILLSWVDNADNEQTYLDRVGPPMG